MKAYAILFAVGALVAQNADAALTRKSNLDAVKKQVDLIVPGYDIGNYRSYTWQPDIAIPTGSQNDYNIHVFNADGDEVLDYTTENANGQFGDFDPSTTVIGVGSNTKVVSSAVFMASCVDTGLATLSTPLSEMLPEIFGPGIPAIAASGDATPEQILSHTSGTPGGGPFCQTLDPTVTTLEECITVMAQADEDSGYAWSTPGEEFIYSNSGFQVIGLVVEKLTGMSWEEAFQMYIAGPTGMSTSTYDCDIQGSTLELPYPGTGMCSAPDDHAKFFQMLLLNGKNPDGTRVISKSSIELMFSDRTNGADLTAMVKFGTWDIWAGQPCGTFMDRFNNEDYINDAKTPDPSTIDPNLLTREDKPILGYGTGVIITTGIKSVGYMHFDSEGWAWYISRGRFAMTLAPLRPDHSGGVSPTPIPAAYVLERDHFPDDKMCPGFNNLENEFIMNQMIDPTIGITAKKLTKKVERYEKKCDMCSMYKKEKCMRLDECYYDSEFGVCRADNCYGKSRDKCKKFKSCDFEGGECHMK